MKLITQTTKIADKWVRCDALSIWFDVAKGFDLATKEKDLIVWYGARKQIAKGEVYWHFEFVDDEGELHEMNCRLDMHTMMLRNNFYPKMILELLNT
jgi:hypothetical protein